MPSGALCGPSAALSSTAATVTVWAVLKVAGVNVRLAIGWSWVPVMNATVTSAVGGAFNTTDNVSVTPPSATAVPPPVSVTVTPGGGVTARQAENSEVSSGATFLVDVAVTTRPRARAGRAAVNAPVGLVTGWIVTFTVPRDVSPSPCPDT